MNITGIIAEYNPFHNGHAYQLACAREETDADYIVIVMSGNFVQRGAPALLDKFTRAKMALMQGADLVIELPVLWSCASAEYFAKAGTALLHQLNCINALCYGCETPDSDLFSKICALISPETPGFQALLSGFLKKGLNYAAARQRAVLSLLPQEDPAKILNILENPNNTLALEYQKAIAASASSLKVHPILRAGQGYHSTDLTGPFVSASAIRRFLSETGGRSIQNKDDSLPLMHAMPAAACRLLGSYQDTYPLLYENDCSQMMHYALLKNAVYGGFLQYADCSADFSNRILRHLDDYTGFTDFCALLKTKNMTYTRISRILTHILLNIRQDDYAYWKTHGYVPYARVLGFRRESRPLLSYLKKHSGLPLLSRAVDVQKKLPKDRAAAFFEKHLFADSVYRALLMQKGGRPMQNEYRRQIVIL